MFVNVLYSQIATKICICLNLPISIVRTVFKVKNQNYDEQLWAFNPIYDRRMVIQETIFKSHG